jgi:hypothetical protein
MNAKNDIFLSLNLSENQMKKQLLFLSFYSFFLTPVCLFSQNTIDPNPNLITKTHFYSFKGNSSIQKADVNRMQEELLKVEFVKDVLIKFSDEKKSGSLKVITQERPVVKEGDHVFSPAVLKNLLFKYNLEPIVYTIEPGVN